MTKTHLIIAGVSVASAAAGTAGGYFFAKGKYEALTEERVLFEVEATKQYYLKLMEKVAEETIIEVLEDVPDDILDIEEDDDDAPMTPEEVAAVEGVREDAKTALVNYAGFADKPALADVVKKNIFDDGVLPSKKPLPPRGEGGKFLPKQGVKADKPPYRITGDEFLENDDPNWEQESLLYYVKAETAVLMADASEAIDTAILGEENLRDFPEDESIYIRNEKLKTDWQITQTYESLAEANGFGLEGGTEDDIADYDEYVNQD